MKGVHSASATDAPVDVIDAMFRASASVRLGFAEFLSQYELTEGRYSVLAALDQSGGGLSQATLAERLMHAESSISSLIDRLQRDGLVDRQMSSSDRRKRVLQLTPAGQSLVDQIEAARRRWAMERLACLHDSDRATLLALLDRVATLEGANLRGGLRTVDRPVVEHEPSAKEWSESHQEDSPQTALERMLSTLRVADRFVGEDR